MGHEEYESLIETLNILADSDTVTAIAEAGVSKRAMSSGGRRPSGMVGERVDGFTRAGSVLDERRLEGRRVRRVRRLGPVSQNLMALTLYRR